MFIQMIMDHSLHAAQDNIEERTIVLFFPSLHVKLRLFSRASDTSSKGCEYLAE